jgi:hypothetical protein
MQTKILPDLLDPKHRVKRESLAMLKEICSYHNKLQKVDTNQTGMTGDVPDYVKYILNTDNAILNFVVAYSDYMKSEQKNYIISKNLVKALKATKLDVECKHLPKDFTAFIEIPDIEDHDGCPFKGFFVSINDEFGSDKITCGYLLWSPEHNDYLPGHINIEFDREKTIKECLLKYPYVVQSVDKSHKSIVSKEYESEFHEYMGVLFNAIVYINNSDDIQLTSNKFATKKSKAEGQKRIYTPKMFHTVGYNLTLPREYTVDSTTVSGHFRWQPYGPGRTLVKHIYIEPHIRSYK